MIKTILSNPLPKLNRLFIMMDRSRLYLEDAFHFYEEALEEFRRGIEENNSYRVRDAAEKAWNAIVQATNSLLLRYMEKIPSSHWERRRLLRDMEGKPGFERYMFRDRYGARERNLHELVFYEGIIDIEDIRYELEKARSYLEDVKKTSIQP
jgi:hypothetical protein